MRSLQGYILPVVEILALIQIVLCQQEDTLEVQLYSYSRQCFVCKYGYGNRVIVPDTQSSRVLELSELDDCGDRTRMGYTDSEYIETCNGQCIKEKTYVDGRQLVKRYCYLEPIDAEFTMADQCVTYQRPGYTTEVCYCSEELCNSAATPYTAIALVMSTLSMLAVQCF
ncbi:PREDICTED: uncharacterized protein LOC106807097 [Priapulus caudatus]|uniref:Uncharacterized protein LOC106807097 n=1 Tax=Priapulus caudatus TaxID=37621 RepID=A0ABM1DY15_PRICU|nr:PREDICTED: uncharacterized protein LOC106807097 [Priapulus caudatus]